MAAIDARLKYLREAAHLLCFTAPTATATFGLARGKLLEDQDLDLAAPPKEWDAFRREVCGACGNLMLPGRSCEVRNEPRPTTGAAGSKRPKQATRRERDVVYACLRCHRKTLLAIPLRAPKHMRKSAPKVKAEPAAVAPKDSSLADKNKVIKTSNASSKQRAKARKGGLSAMLAQSKSQSSASKGLDLMDFMS